jgi:hypothetical protein
VLEKATWHKTAQWTLVISGRLPLFVSLAGLHPPWHTNAAAVLRAGGNDCDVLAASDEGISSREKEAFIVFDVPAVLVEALHYSGAGFICDTICTSSFPA